MPNAHLARYRYVVEDLKDLVVDLKDIATDTQESISQVEATLAQYHLKEILTSLMSRLQDSFALGGVPSTPCRKESLDTRAEKGRRCLFPSEAR